jgi:hypothetical protein
MSDLDKIELAIRRAASQMPNGQARAFRLVADELQDLDARVSDAYALKEYRTKKHEGD